MNVNIFYDSVNVFSVLFTVLVVPVDTLYCTPCDLQMRESYRIREDTMK